MATLIAPPIALAQPPCAHGFVVGPQLHANCLYARALSPGRPRFPNAASGPGSLVAYPALQFVGAVPYTHIPPAQSPFQRHVTPGGFGTCANLDASYNHMPVGQPQPGFHGGVPERLLQGVQSSGSVSGRPPPNVHGGGNLAAGEPQHWVVAGGFAAEQPQLFAPSVGAGKQQESERLERMKPRYADRLVNTGTDHVRLVSFGCMCGVKLTFQQLGRGAETLPFDWCYSRLKGILHFMRSDFQGFYDYTTMMPDVNGMTMYRSVNHSFWHDNPDDEDMREKYTRRISRFKAIDASTQPILFVRAIASTDELKMAEEFLLELTTSFGEQAHLLLIIDFQKRMRGAAFVNGIPRKLMLYFHTSKDRDPAFAPYMLPVVEGLKWASGQVITATAYQTLQDVFGVVDETHWGYTAHRNIRSFEDPPPAIAAKPRRRKLQ
mmetsp:Transcript_72890/g.202220  ORF Transcript_72890/g.202220 Transcript_72890/m.202220 type:complete len:435 (-) Transcript_72890:32-1336(-)